VALVAGVLLALAFPQPGIAGLAWVAPGLLFLASLGLPAGPAFRVGWLAGMAHHLVALRWLTHIPHSVGAYAAWLSLGAYCAVYLGLWSMYVSRWVRVSSEPTPTSSRGLPRSRPAFLSPFSGSLPGLATPVSDAPADSPVSGGTPAWGPWRQALGRYASTVWFRRAAIPASLAAAWVALEWLRGWFLTGFPWNFLGVSQWRQVPLIQLAAVTGVYGVSFLVCWGSVALAGALVVLVGRPVDRWSWLAETRLPLLAVLAAAGLGFYGVVQQRRRESAAPAETVRLALIQPSIPQTLLWDPDEGDEAFGVAYQLSRQALAFRPDVLVWPEGAFGLSPSNYARVVALTRTAGVPWVFGAADEETDAQGTRRAYNAAYLAGSEGRLGSVYHKRRLVIFGEYIPLERWLPFLRLLTPISSGFDAGDRPVGFALGTNGPVASPVICFEDLFPHGVRDHAGPGVDFLLELTNDAWFGRSSAQWQHAANAAFRAVENG
ncbi:MAG: apolipoprotein N-acyltransferase, partial [Verrucomicrobiota bacterium]